MLASLRGPDHVPRKLKPAPVERVTPKNRKAIEGMVWLALNRADAAKYAGLSEHSLYTALRKSHVRALYLRELEVLRTSERARNIHALCETRDQTESWNARVQAVNALTAMDNPLGGPGERGATAGFVIQVIAPLGSTVAGRTIEHSPADSTDAPRDTPAT